MRVTTFVSRDGRKEVWLGACVEPGDIIEVLWGRRPTPDVGRLTYLETP